MKLVDFFQTAKPETEEPIITDRKINGMGTGLPPFGYSPGKRAGWRAEV
jgi:hypothetical protein